MTEIRTARTGRRTRLWIVAFCLVLCVAGFVRFSSLGRLSLWGDEPYRAQELTKGLPAPAHLG